jgi:intergrase/recombinase
MAGVVGSTPTRPTTFSLFPSDLRNNATVKQMVIANLRRYPNQALPSVSSPALAASESCNAASIDCNAAKAEDPKHWLEFHNFLLQKMTPKTAEDRLRYAKRYNKVLETGNASGLLQLQPNKRIHAMKALSNLAKFTGEYDKFLQIRQRYNLKWSTGTEKLDAFERFFDDNKTLDTMMQWLSQVRQELPKSYSNFFIFCTLTGLRASECIACIRLIKDPDSFKRYYNGNRQCLEHFRFTNIFIRRTKAAYISLVDKEILELAQNCTSIRSYNALKKALMRRSLDMQLKYCRKIFASYLRQSGIESEIIDLLQGRVPKSVFARHYFTPSLDYRDKVIRALDNLRQYLKV